MIIVRTLGGMVQPLPMVLVTVIMLVALGCGLFSLPSVSKSTPAPQTSGTEWQRSESEIHAIPVTGENIGVEVGKHVPPFALGLADGSVVTSTDLLEASQPTFLFFWATT